MQSWNSDGLWKKAKLFMDKANESDHASSEFAFHASLALECLGRSALTKVHPVLNADPREDTSILYACGYSFAKPRSLPAHAVFLRLEKIVDPFQKQHREVCEFLALQRNAHVHTADLPYENLGTDKWIARFYETVAVLHDFLGKPLEQFLGKQGAKMAGELIKTLNESVLKAVKKKIAAYHAVFETKSDEEKKKLLDAASSIFAIVTNHNQHLCACPACQGNGMLTGSRFKELAEQYSDGELYHDVEYLSAFFQCNACELSFSSIEEIAHAGLPTHFKKMESTSLHDLYEPDHYQEYDNM
jgi:hypothetical protein